MLIGGVRDQGSLSGAQCPVRRVVDAAVHVDLTGCDEFVPGRAVVDVDLELRCSSNAGGADLNRGVQAARRVDR